MVQHRFLVQPRWRTEPPFRQCSCVVPSSPQQQQRVFAGLAFSTHSDLRLTEAVESKGVVSNVRSGREHQVRQGEGCSGVYSLRPMRDFQCIAGQSDLCVCVYIAIVASRVSWSESKLGQLGANVRVRCRVAGGMSGFEARCSCEHSVLRCVGPMHGSTLAARISA